MKLISFIKKNYYLLIYFLLSFCVIFPNINDIQKYQYASSKGDHPVIVDINKKIQEFSLYSNTYSGGYPTPFELANFMPFYFFLYLLNFFGFSIFLSTFLFFSANIFLGLISTFKLGKLLSKNHNIDNYFLTIGPILYIFNPYFMEFFEPGHILILSLFYLFPMYMYLMTRIYDNNKLSLRYMIILFVFFFLGATPFANVSHVAIFFIGSILFQAIYYYCNQFSLKTFLYRNTILVILFITANAWSLFPSATYYITTYSQQKNYTNQSIGSFIGSVSQLSNILNSLSDRANGPIVITKRGGNLMIDKVYLLYSLTIFIVVITFLWRQNKKSHTTSIFLIAIILLWLVKGISSPYGNIFNFLYDNVPGFGILRRPASKLYWIYLLFFTHLVILSFNYFSEKYKKKSFFIKMIFLLISAFSIFHFTCIKPFTPFNIPEEYFTLKKHLEDNSTTGILTYPNLSNLPIYYDESINSIGGVDFFEKMNAYPLYGADVFNATTLNRDINRVANDLLNLEPSDKLYCNKLAELNISHVILRKNITNTSQSEINRLSIKLENAKYLHIDYRQSNKLFNMYEVDDDCKNISFMNNTAKIIRTLPHRLDISNSNNKIYLNIINDTNWKYLETTSPVNEFDILLKLLNPKNDQIKPLVFTGINTAEISTDKSEVIVFYTPQYYIYLFLCIDGALIITGVMGLFYLFVSRNYIRTNT